MYDNKHGLYIAHCSNGPISMVGKMANRHGLIAGATGTGKTVTLQVMAETLSQAGVPCFMADIKGDLSGISKKGMMTKFIEKRCDEFGLDKPKFQSCPVRFFDVFGEQGHPIRATISSMGADLISRLLELNPTQSGVLNIVFRIASDENLPLIDLKDLRQMLDFVSKNASNYTTTYGNISPQTIGAIQRALLSLENQGADSFFGEPDFDIRDLLATEGGLGVLSVLAADRLIQSPKVYSTFLMWLLNEIYTTLPEVGDMDLPKLVFFFDEAHLLFDDANKALLDNIERVVRLVRSKGVGVYFVTQNPIDIPDSILGQLGNRVQHALRAFTPRDQKAVKAAAQTFRANPAFDTEDAIQQLGTGEALVSFLDEKGAPTVVECAKVLFPLSQIGAITPDERKNIIGQSLIYGKYDKRIDRESAFEILVAKKEQELKESQREQNEKSKEKEAKGKSVSKRKKSGFWSAVAAIAMPILTSMGRSIGREVVKNVTGKSTTTRKRKKMKRLLPDSVFYSAMLIIIIAISVLQYHHHDCLGHVSFSTETYCTASHLHISFGGDQEEEHSEHNHICSLNLYSDPAEGIYPDLKPDILHLSPVSLQYSLRVPKPDEFDLGVYTVSDNIPILKGYQSVSGIRPPPHC